MESFLKFQGADVQLLHKNTNNNHYYDNRSYKENITVVCRDIKLRLNAYMTSFWFAV